MYRLPQFAQLVVVSDSHSSPVSDIPYQISGVLRSLRSEVVFFLKKNAEVVVLVMLL